MRRAEADRTSHPPERVSVTIDPPAESLNMVLREALFIGSIVVSIGLASILPGTERALPGTGVLIGEAIVAVGLIVTGGSLLYATPKARVFVAGAVDGPPALVAQFPSLARHFVVLIAVLITHRGVTMLAWPVLAPNGTAWLLDAVFLGFGLVPVCIIAYRLVLTTDPLARLLGQWFFNRSATEP